LAKTDHCPICNVSVKPENLVRHLNDIHPRHPETPRLREELKAEVGRVAPKRTSVPLRIQKWQVALVALIVLGGVGVYYLTRGPPLPYPCVSGVGTYYHWHTQLTITSGGNPVTIPGSIGITPTCLEVLHTHDTSGLIHIEPDTAEQGRVYTIGDFFVVWGKPFGSPIHMFLNGTEIPPSPTVGLYDRPEAIILQYTSFIP